MSDPFPELDELRALLDALCDETIQPEQLSRLEAIVLARPEAEAFYVQWMSLHADLISHFAVTPARLEQSLRDRLKVRQPPAGEPAGTEPVTSEPAAAEPVAAVHIAVGTVPAPPPARLRRARRLLWPAAAAVAAGLLTFFVTNKRPIPTTSAPGPGPEAVDNTVAVLIQAPGAKWEDDSLQPRAGGPLPPGWLRLKSGLAHLEFYNGATVILQGPAEFQLISRTEAFCARGKLRALVPPQAHGFTIGSPKVNLVDRGTEFGLDVGAEQTEVHVFQGKVELFDTGARVQAGPQPQAPPSRELTTGQGVRLEGPGQPRAIDSNSAGFVTAQGLAEHSKKEIQLRQQAWRKASAMWGQDPSLLLYYTFEAKEPWPRTLLDRVSARQEPRDGAIVGCSWAAGRWPGKTGLEFRRVSDRVRLQIPGEFESITLASWVRVDALPNRNNSLLMSDGWDSGELHWQIGEDGTIILGVQSRPKGKGAHYHAREVFGPELLGQWVHLAVTYDRENGTVTHYVNSRPYAQLAIDFDFNIPLRVGDAEIGNWNMATHRNNTPIRFFTGCMDEFMMFDRALSDQEIERLWNDGKPTL